MHILPFLGSTTSSILGTGVGSSMSFVRSSCSSSSFCPLLFPYKAACLKEITHKFCASCNCQMFSSSSYSSDIMIKTVGENTYENINVVGSGAGGVNEKYPLYMSKTKEVFFFFFK